MGIQDLTDNIILVDATPEPNLNEELKNAIEIVRERGDCDVIVDFSHVDIVTSSSLSKLLKLRKLLMDCNRSLVLCSVSKATKAIFSVTALDGIFQMEPDKTSAKVVIDKSAVNQPL